MFYINSILTDEKDKDILRLRFNMADVVGVHAKSLSVHGLEASGTVHWNLPVESLVELAVARGEEFTAHTKRL